MMRLLRFLSVLTIIIFNSCGKQQSNDEVNLEPRAEIEFLDAHIDTASGAPIARFSFKNTAEYSYDLRSIMRDDDGSIHCHHPSFRYKENGKLRKIDITYAGVVDLTRVNGKEEFILLVPLNGLAREPQKDSYILVVDEIESLPFQYTLRSSPSGVLKSQDKKQTEQDVAPDG